MVRFVTIKKFCELTGFTAAAVYTRKSKGIWPEGSVWRYEPGSAKILMDLQAYDAWVESGGQLSSIDARGPTTSALRPLSLAPPAPRPNSRRATRRSPMPPKLDR